MNKVYFDTVGIIALLDEDDQWHQAAEKAYHEILTSKADIFTTSQVLLECGNAASRRPYRKDVAELRTSFAQSNRLIEISLAEEELAWQQYFQSTFGTSSIVDHISFLAMHKSGISHAFTNDKHFSTAGFQNLF